VGVVILRYIDPALVLSFYSLACTVFCLCISQLSGWSGVGCLFCLFFFESICYPCIFTIGTKNLGRWTKQGSGLIVQGVGGGAWYPPAQGSLAVSLRRALEALKRSLLAGQGQYPPFILGPNDRIHGDDYVCCVSVIMSPVEYL
jgi:fucose permease